MSGGSLTFEESVIFGSVRSEGVSQDLPVCPLLLSSLSISLPIAILLKNMSGTTHCKETASARGGTFLILTSGFCVDCSCQDILIVGWGHVLTISDVYICSDGTDLDIFCLN